MEVAATVTKAGTAIQHYVPPVLGLAAGYVIGDIIGLGGFIKTQITKGQSAGVDAQKAALGITAGIYALIAVALWKGIGGWVGSLVAGFFAGIAIRLALKMAGM